MLVFNRALYKYIVEVRKILGMEDVFEISTVNDFVYYNLYDGKKEGKEKNLIDKPVPFIGDNKYNTDWEKVKEDIKKLGKIYDHIVIDEGQDFNVDFYKALKNITKFMTVFADPNQSIQKDGAYISDILSVLNKESYFTLTLNYRNSKNIVDFTRRYCCDKSIFAESYRDKDDLEILDFNEDTYVDVIKNIINKYSEDINIGIVVPNIKDENGNTDRKYEYGLYHRLDSGLNKKYKVSVYYNENVHTDDNVKKLRNVDFSINSIKIFNYATIRGLDFDVVILIDNISNYIENSEDESDKISFIKRMNSIYISSTRAKEKLYVLKKDLQNTIPYIDNNITYAYFDNISGISLDECLNSARDAEENEQLALALYYYHYAIAVIGIEDKELLKRALCSFANLCINYNKSDFALGSIYNYSYKYDDVDDQDLIFFYQSALLHSYNDESIYSNIDKFFNNISKLISEDDKDDLISEFYNGYIRRCYNNNILPDINYAKELIDKYNYQNYKSYKNFLSNCEKYIEDDETSENNEEDGAEDLQSQALKNWIANLTPHELLDKSYITVVSGTNNNQIDFEKKAESKGFKSEDFDFNLDYNKFTNKLFDYIKKDSDKPAAIIYGSAPHSMKNKGDFSSLLMKWKQPRYPKVFEAKHKKSLSLGTFKMLLDQIVAYLRDNFYRKKKSKML